MRNSTTAAVPGVDVLQNFQLSKQDFEKVFLDAAERFEDSRRPQPQSGVIDRRGRSGRVAVEEGKVAAKGRRKKGKIGKVKEGRLELGSVVVKKLGRKISGEGRADVGKKEEDEDVLKKKVSLPRLNEYGGRDSPIKKGKVVGGAGAGGGFVGGDKRVLVREDESFGEVEKAAVKRSDGLRRLAAGYQGKGEMGMAGSMFEQAIDTRSRFGLHCTLENGDSHVEYAQNLSKRGLIAEAEYHLRTAADVYRQQNATSFRKYADILLYLAVIIDRQGRLVEAEAFYRAALGVYRGCKLGDDNVRVAIDNLSNNLRAQGREDEVEYVIKSHFSGPPASSSRRRR